MPFQETFWQNDYNLECLADFSQASADYFTIDTMLRILKLEKCLFETSNYSKKLKLGQLRKRRDLDVSEWEYVVNYFTQEKFIVNRTNLIASDRKYKKITDMYFMSDTFQK